jgi:hypothetical protein
MNSAGADILRPEFGNFPGTLMKAEVVKVV